jgi:hypothetical protein
MVAIMLLLLHSQKFGVMKDIGDHLGFKSVMISMLNTILIFK